MSYTPALTPALSPRRGSATVPLVISKFVAAFGSLSSAANGVIQPDNASAPPLLGERAGVRAVQNTFNEAILPAVHV